MKEQDNPESKSPQVTKDNRTDHFKEITDFARSEIEWVRSAYKWLISLVAVVALVGVSVGIYFTYKSSSDFKKETREDLDRLGKQVERHIEEQFKKENINKMVEEKAKARIDEIANALIDKQISDKISPQINSAQEKLEKIQKDFKITEDNIRELNAVSEFTMMVIAAQNDDRKAFDKLKSWANDPKFPRSSEAQQAWIKVMDEHESPFGQSFDVKWKDGIDPAKLSLTELDNAFKLAPSFIRVGILEYIWKRQDIPKKEKMLFLVKVIKSDSSLKLVEYAARYFIQESKQNLKRLAIDEHLAWWDKNKDKFNGK